MARPFLRPDPAGTFHFNIRDREERKTWGREEYIVQRNKSTRRKNKPPQITTELYEVDGGHVVNVEERAPGQKRSPALPRHLPSQQQKAPLIIQDQMPTPISPFEHFGMPPVMHNPHHLPHHPPTPPMPPMMPFQHAPPPPPVHVIHEPYPVIVPAPQQAQHYQPAVHFPPSPTPSEVEPHYVEVRPRSPRSRSPSIHLHVTTPSPQPSESRRERSDSKSSKHVSLAPDVISHKKTTIHRTYYDDKDEKKHKRHQRRHRDRADDSSDTETEKSYRTTRREDYQTIRRSRSPRTEAQLAIEAPRRRGDDDAIEKILYEREKESKRSKKYIYA